MDLSKLSHMNEAEVQSAILYLSKMLASRGTNARLTIYPYDRLTGFTFVECDLPNVKDVDSGENVRSRIKLTKEMMHMDSHIDGDTIDKLVNHVEQLAEEVDQYHEAYNQERRKQQNL